MLTTDFENMEIISNSNKSNYSFRGVCQEIMEREEVETTFSRRFMLKEDKWE